MSFFGSFGSASDGADEYFVPPSMTRGSAERIAQLVVEKLQFQFDYNKYSYVSFTQDDLVLVKRIITNQLQKTALSSHERQLLADDKESEIHQAIAGNISFSERGIDISKSENNGITTTGLVKVAFNQSHIWKANLSSAAAMFGGVKKNEAGQYYALYFTASEINARVFGDAIERSVRETLLALPRRSLAPMGSPPPYSASATNRGPK